MKKKMHASFTPLNIYTLFRKGTTKQYFTSVRQIPTQLKLILKSDPDYEVKHALSKSGHEIKVQPKPDINALLATMGLDKKLRGVGFTRPSKKISKQARKQSYKSRKRNRS